MTDVTGFTTFLTYRSAVARLDQEQEPGVRGGAARGGGGLGQMICLAARCLVVCGVLLLPMTRAAAVELEIGARFPAEPNEKIVVKNDGGVRNATASFPQLLSSGDWSRAVCDALLGGDGDGPLR